MYDNKPVQKHAAGSNSQAEKAPRSRQSANLDPSNQPSYAEQVQMHAPVQKKKGDDSKPAEVSLERDTLWSLGSNGYEATIEYTGALTERQRMMREIGGQPARETQTQYVEIRFGKGGSAAESGKIAAKAFVKEGGPADSAPGVAVLVENAIKDGNIDGGGE